MKTILLVNNDRAALNSLEDILQRCRYAVIATHDGSDALAKIASGERIDLVITDHRMNGIGDLAILKAIRQTRHDVPVIILAERGTLDSYLKAINLGVTEYLENAGGYRELLRAVAKALDDGAEKEKDSTITNMRCKAGHQAVRTSYDRGYAEMVRN
jgi:DNA-binding NtrC family response regulator